MEQILKLEYPSSLSSLEYLSAEELGCHEADLFVADGNTAPFLTPEQREKTLVLPPGEPAKQLSSVEKILSRAVEARLDRGSLITGIGGGVICDMTAFAASLYMRGCRVNLIPTTLLAMVDAAVGGKTGVDFGSYKNMAGTFYPAERVLFNTDYLKNLPQREYLCGLAEVIKTGILGDEELFVLLETRYESLLERDEILLKEVITRCVKVKGQIVQEDLKEKGLRACLNLGHTFGHALETVTGFSRISHGEAVAWGMAKAASAALLRGDLSQELYDRLIKLLKRYGFRLNWEFNTGSLKEAMTHDKKSRGGTVNFVLPAGMEAFLMTPLSDDLLDQVLSEKI